MTRIWLRRAASLGLLLPALLGLACSRSPEAVATIKVTPAELRLPFPGFATLSVELTPLVALPPGLEPQLFLHLLDEPGSVIRTFDLPVPGEWVVGRAILFPARIHQSALADPLESGVYLLTAGLYARDGGRFALESAGPTIARQEYQVATVTIPAAGDSLPTLRFSEGWLPAAPGQDRQVLVRRGLDGMGPATFQIGPLQGPGRLLLRLAPSPGRMELAEGAASPKVRLRSSCGGFEAELSGDVAAETEIEVPPAEGPISCDVELAPNFVARSDADGKQRSVVIEVLAWRAGTADE